jgi:hypothetical protein
MFSQNLPASAVELSEIRSEDLSPYPYVTKTLGLSQNVVIHVATVDVARVLFHPVPLRVLKSQ